MSRHFAPRLDTIEIAPWKGYLTVGASLVALLAVALWFNL